MVFWPDGEAGPCPSHAQGLQWGWGMQGAADAAPDKALGAAPTLGDALPPFTFLLEGCASGKSHKCGATKCIRHPWVALGAETPHWAPRDGDFLTCSAKPFVPRCQAHAAGQESPLPALGDTDAAPCSVPSAQGLLRDQMSFGLSDVSPTCCASSLPSCPCSSSCSRKSLVTTLSPPSPQTFPWEHRQRLLFLAKPYIHRYTCVCVCVCVCN